MKPDDVAEPGGPLSCANEFELQALCGVIQASAGCVLPFVRVNHESLRDRLAAEAKRRVPGIVECTLDPKAESGIVEQWEASLRGRRPAALFVCGIERISDLETVSRGRIAGASRFPSPSGAPDFTMLELSSPAARSPLAHLRVRILELK